ncbi:putative leucine-rich repeat domain superfamily [Helianthus annuus]|nr:putative leucine-rich repeat domain superfamily [Helianthus annuus]
MRIVTMENENERRGKRSVMPHKRTAVDAVGGNSLLESLPEVILNEIFSFSQPETLTSLCSLACVSRTLQSSVNKPLSSLSSLDLSALSLDPQTFHGITRNIRKINKITLDCLRLHDSSITNLLGPDLEELILLKCSSLSYKLLSSVGKYCPNLRVLTLEFSGNNHKSAVSDLNFRDSFVNCQHLESVIIKIRGEEVVDYGYMLLGIYQELPPTVKFLKLQPASALDTVVFLNAVGNANLVAPVTPMIFGQALTHVSLVVDVISDTLLRAITRGLPLLVELDLKDRPTSEPTDVLSNLGIQSIVNCKQLTSLSLMRSRRHYVPFFRRATDMGMFLLSEGCRGLESVRFGGFSKVTDAGFASIYNSYVNLKKFEIRNGFLLTDLAFQDFSKAPRSLVEVKLVSCDYITSEAVRELVTCSTLEVLDLLGCKSVSDSCLNKVSRLSLLTSLNLGGTGVTDVGMAVLGKGNAPISCLSLRGCRSVSDEGIISLLQSEGKIRKTLSSLDLENMPELTDNAITTIADACVGLTELSIRYCIRVTDASVKALALKGGVRRLDLYKCTALSGECLQYLKKPFFRGLRWIGIGRTRLAREDPEFDEEICRERQWLTVCKDGCELGCHDGWQDHEF